MRQNFYVFNKWQLHRTLLIVFYAWGGIRTRINLLGLTAWQLSPAGLGQLEKGCNFRGTTTIIEDCLINGLTGSSTQEETDCTYLQLISSGVQSARHWPDPASHLSPSSCAILKDMEGREKNESKWPTKLHEKLLVFVVITVCTIKFNGTSQ